MNRVASGPFLIDFDRFFPCLAILGTPFGTSKSHISLTGGSPDHFWTQKASFLVLQFSTLFWDPLFKTLFELWTNLGMILDVFWHRFGGNFLKRPI